MALSFRRLREGASDYAYQPRDPQSKAFVQQHKLLNAHLLVNYKKLSVPVGDDNVFKAANIGDRQGQHDHGDNTTPDDQSVGYRTPILFGDYVKHLCDMKAEGVELSDAEAKFVLECFDLSDEDFDRLYEQELVITLDEQVLEAAKKSKRIPVQESMFPLIEYTLTDEDVKRLWLAAAIKMKDE